MFRRIVDLSRKTDTFRDSANVEIIELHFSTRDLKNLPGDFFSPANYRDKINRIGVHVIDTGEPTIPDNDGVDGELRYGGTTYFRTRIPVCPDTRQQIGFNSKEDLPGEYIIAPFRYYEDTGFTGIFLTMTFSG